MVNIQQASLTKERIISTIKSKGPSLPIHIARAVSIQPLFAAAFLSELYGEQKIKISNIKVGSSPLYYLEGQEPMLENFIEHLNSKEREAFLLLKKEKFLEDETQLPAIRVAIRGLKDFAIPIKVKKDSQEKIFWRYFLIQENEFISLINKELPKIQIETPKEVIVEKKEEIREEIPVQPIIEETPVEKIKETIKEIETAIAEKVEDQEEEKVQKEEKKEEKKPVKKKVKQEDLKFVNNITDYLNKKDIEVIETLLEKKKEFIAKVRTDTPFGKQEYLLIAKDKKKISEEELTIALQKASENKMQVLILAPGEIDKKAIVYAETWRNILKFEKVSFK